VASPLVERFETAPCLAAHEGEAPITLQQYASSIKAIQSSILHADGLGGARSVLGAFAFEIAAAICLYGLWKLCHIL